MARSAFHGPKSGIVSYRENIEREEEGVYKLVRLVQSDNSSSDMEKGFQSLHNSLRSMKEKSEKPKMSMAERRHTVLQWLRSVNTDIDFDMNHRNRQAGTCDWIFRRGAFKDWVRPSLKSKILWIHGKPGSGKSVMSTRMIQYLAEEAMRTLAFFYCVSEDELKRDPYAIIRSWISQMVKQNDAALESAELMHKSREERAPTISELWKLFRAISRKIPDPVYVVDGFDECSYVNTTNRLNTADGRTMFLREFMEALAETASQVIITSRDNIDIRTELRDATSEGSPIELFEHMITQDDNFEDIQIVSKDIVSRRLSKKSTSLKMEIAESAAIKSDGMFLWLVLLGDALNPGKNTKALRNAVSDMPSGIEKAYKRDLDRLSTLRKEERNHAVALLRWILFAVRPLTVRELLEALALTTNNTEDAYPMDDLPDAWEEGGDVEEDYVDEMIRKPCGSLVEIRKKDADQRLESQTVHFVHFSVKEYLLGSEDLGQSRLQELAFTDKSSENDYLATLCVHYLCYDVFGETSGVAAKSLEEKLQIYSFLSYAAKGWMDHASRARTMSMRLIQYAEKLIRPATFNFALWEEVFTSQSEPAGKTDDEVLDAESQNLREEQDPMEDDGEDEVKKDEDSIPAESLEPQTEGLAAEVDKAKDGNDASDHSKHEQLQKGEIVHRPGPVYYAAHFGFIDIMKHLLAKGYDCNDECGKQGPPLHVAIMNGHVEVAEHMIRHGADVNKKGSQYGFPVIAASARGYQSLVELLIKSGSDVHAVTDRGRTALHLACRQGSVDLVNTLLEHGADVNAESKTGETPFCRACASGNLDVVRLLLDKGMSPMARQGGGWDSLRCAIRHNHEDVVRLLIDRGADVNFVSARGYTPLHVSAQYCRAPLNEYLLSVGANASLGAKDFEKNGRHPLCLAINRNDTPLPVTKVLLKYGADFSMVTDIGSTMLHCAVEALADNDALLSLILDQNAQPIDKVDSAGYTALDDVLFSARSDCASSLTLLLDRGANVSFQHDIESVEEDERGWFPLHRAVLSKSQVSPVMVQVLIDRGANVDAITSNGLSPLHNLLRWNAENALEHIKVLLDNGADINLETEKGWTPLCFAVSNVESSRVIDITRALLGRGAKPNHKVKSEAAPLHFAVISKSASCELVKLLIDFGADPNIQGERQLTPLHDAANQGRVDIVKLLLEHKADVHLTNNSKKTALHYSISSPSSDHEIVKTLLDAGCNVHALDDWQQNALTLAAARGSVEIVKLLIEAGVDVNAEDSAGLTPLHCLFKSTSEDVPEVCKLLVDNGASVNKADGIGLSPLHVLLQYAPKGLLDVFKLLLDRGSDVNQVAVSGFLPLHALFSSSPDGILEIFRILLDEGADIHGVTQDGWSPLDFAVYLVTNPEALLEITKRLTKLGASTNHNNGKDSTTLMLAIRADSTNTDVLKVLIEAGADVNGGDHKDNTPLHEAVFANKPDFVKLLLENHADAKARNQSNNNAFHEASFKGNPAIIDSLAKAIPDHYSYYDGEGDNTFSSGILFRSVEAAALAAIENGGLLIPKTEANGTQADCSEVLSTEDDKTIIAMQKAAYAGDEEKANGYIAEFVRLSDTRALNCALHAAVGGNSLELARHLLDNGAEIESMVGNDRTPLHMAAMGDFHDLIKLLLDRGANPRSRDVVGISPLELGIRPERPHIDFITLMIKHGGLADPADVCKDKHQQAELTGFWDGMYAATGEEGLDGTNLFWWDPESLNSNAPYFRGRSKNASYKWNILGQLLYDGTVRFTGFTNEDTGYVYVGKLDTEERTITGSYGLSTQILKAGTFSLKAVVPGAKKIKDDESKQGTEAGEKLDQAGDDLEETLDSDAIKDSDGVDAMDQEQGGS